MATAKGSPLSPLVPEFPGVLFRLLSRFTRLPFFSRISCRTGRFGFYPCSPFAPAAGRTRVSLVPFKLTSFDCFVQSFSVVFYIRCVYQLNVPLFFCLILSINKIGILFFLPYFTSTLVLPSPAFVLLYTS